MPQVNQVSWMFVVLKIFLLFVIGVLFLFYIYSETVLKISSRITTFFFKNFV